jgi:hypothetical protein
VESEATVGERFVAIAPQLNEWQRRLWVGAEARVLGRGGISLVARATGVSRRTIYKAAAEFDDPPELEGRVRRPGGGRKRLRDLDPGLDAALGALADPCTRGDTVCSVPGQAQAAGLVCVLPLLRGAYAS